MWPEDPTIIHYEEDEEIDGWMHRLDGMSVSLTKKTLSFYKGIYNKIVRKLIKTGREEFIKTNLYMQDYRNTIVELEKIGN